MLLVTTLRNETGARNGKKSTTTSGTWLSNYLALNATVTCKQKQHTVLVFKPCLSHKQYICSIKDRSDCNNAALVILPVQGEAEVVASFHATAHHDHDFLYARWCKLHCATKHALPASPNKVMFHIDKILLHDRNNTYSTTKVRENVVSEINMHMRACTLVVREDSQLWELQLVVSVMLDHNQLVVFIQTQNWSTSSTKQKKHSTSTP